MTRVGGGVQTPPKKDDIIFEQPHIATILVVLCTGAQRSNYQFINFLMPFRKNHETNLFNSYMKNLFKSYDNVHRGWQRVDFAEV